ncbi:BT_3987 domain-containing protein [Parabacteroides pacaensis]|uniref:BT_3987 domain-containing protein n=1 Tax=Parabacteroides pacaensis TaxID=2086575 RepID=UPI000D0E424E|nr:DUF1735 domain-containing protein [Parabacteroides pacaensis]
MKIKIIAIVLLAVCLGACSESKVDFGEQYKKTLYIVNSRDMLYVGEHSYGSENNFIKISVYCASTEPVKSDLRVKLRIAPEALDSLNKKSALGNPLYVDKVLLPESHYELSDTEVTIAAGSQYGVLRIPLHPEGLNADVSYALPVTIESNTMEYEVNPELQTMVYEVKMINGYSGEYAGSSIELPKTIRSVQPVLKAMSSNTVRLPIHTLSSEVKYLNTNFMLLTVGADSTSVAISPWAEAQVTDLGGSTYDRKTKRYVLNYSFKNENGDIIRIEEKIQNLEVPDTDDEESE